MQFESCISDNLYSDLAPASSALKIDAISTNSELAYEVEMEGVRCTRGILVAAALEAGAAILFFGIWQCWHLLR